MHIDKPKINFFRGILFPKIKNIFNFRNIKLERQPVKDVYINTIKYVDGIKSKTFKTLLSTEYTPTRRIDISGARVTTLIDKKSNKPIEAFVAQVESEDPLLERYAVMVKNPEGEIVIGNQRFNNVGETYFYVNKEAQMITPKFGATYAENEHGQKELVEKVESYMKSDGNDKFGGIGVRLHQLRVERMLMNKFGNVCIVAQGNSFPFHYKMGYRLFPQLEDMQKLQNVVNQLCRLNQKSSEYNYKFVSVEEIKGKHVINVSHSIENCLNDYYKNGGKDLDNFMPNMYLTGTSARQWIELIKKQPILIAGQIEIK